MRTLILSAAVTLLLPAGCVAQQEGLDEAALTITQADYLSRVGVIAHDSMQGRDTPSPGLDATAEWLASELRAMGLQGGAESGGFIQRYPLRAVAVDADESSLSGGGVQLRFGEDLLPLTGAPASGRSVGGLVLVSGSGNPGSVLASGAVRGKHTVLVLSADAQGLDQSLFRLVLGMRNAGAASVMITNPTEDERWAQNAARVDN